MCFKSTTSVKFLNQASAWFLRIASVREYLYACVFVGVYVCASAPKAINNQWRDVV